MGVIIINPNSTESMTEAMVSAARNAAPDLQFDGWTSVDGPASIQGAQDGAAATPHLLRLVRRASDCGAEGIIIGCFDDTALKEASSLVDCPVVGLGQASYHYAALKGWKFSVVTTLAASVPVLEANVRNLGFRDNLARVRASDVPVLALEENPALSGEAIKQEALQAEENDDIGAVILGCAGMVQVVEDVQNALTIEAIDPVTCTARCMTWLV